MRANPYSSRGIYPEHLAGQVLDPMTGMPLDPTMMGAGSGMPLDPTMAGAGGPPMSNAPQMPSAPPPMPQQAMPGAAPPPPAENKSAAPQLPMQSIMKGLGPSGFVDPVMQDPAMFSQLLQGILGPQAGGNMPNIQGILGPLMY